MNEQLWVVKVTCISSTDHVLVWWVFEMKTQSFLNKLKVGRMMAFVVTVMMLFFLQNAAQSLKAAMRNGGNVSLTCALLFIRKLHLICNFEQPVLKFCVE